MYVTTNSYSIFYISIPIYTRSIYSEHTGHLYPIRFSSRFGYSCPRNKCPRQLSPRKNPNQFGFFASLPHLTTEIIPLTIEELAYAIDTLPAGGISHCTLSIVERGTSVIRLLRCFEKN
ncbi:hypothetical protein PDIG_49720 [Penicillium digitatum PHI26]|uniref:Uncharacterized protein n=2 Tax=Penicillium digitatum TaxID=36651 RepID=K9FQS6_PEND2|nr:hypothetical protein PDIP_42580 [Penicillium digitatum Pd1]EKV11529.1 hypothetical protein PDIG_49720 [Penicillium digitatum PHI26]EKV14749.1 hypothetical protein PDIP_42580 [Penicillium digitatum Pd1]